MKEIIRGLIGPCDTRPDVIRTGRGPAADWPRLAGLHKHQPSPVGVISTAYIHFQIPLEYFPRECVLQKNID